MLRRTLIHEYGAESAADIMLIDVAVLSYAHTLRINGWVGNLAAETEAEFFGEARVGVVVAGQRRSPYDVKVKGLRVVEILGRLNEQILPLLDRSNRMMIRNLKALDARHRPPSPSVSIAQAGQVNASRPSRITRREVGAARRRGIGRCVETFAAQCSPARRSIRKRRTVTQDGGRCHLRTVGPLRQGPLPVHARRPETWTVLRSVLVAGRSPLQALCVPRRRHANVGCLLSPPRG